MTRFNAHALDARPEHDGARVVAYLGLGSNLGDRERALEAAIARLAMADGALRVRRVSSRYETEPLVAADSSRDAPAPWYLNCVVEAETTLSPNALLSHVQAVEAALGREPARARWAPRTIDIDILLYGAHEIRAAQLTIPHAGLTARRFVLEPLAEIAPQTRVPGTGRTVAEHLSALSDPLRVILYAGRGPGECG